MVLTKQDLQEWNSHPVTQAVFKKIAEEVEEPSLQSTMMDTVDQTALRRAHQVGFLHDSNSLREYYELCVHDAE